MNSIGYALASPLWSEGDRAYLTYLKKITEQQIKGLEGSAIFEPPSVIGNRNKSINQGVVELIQQAANNNANNANNSSNALNQLFGGEAYLQYLESLPLEELRSIALDRAYHYLVQMMRMVGNKTLDEIMVMDTDSFMTNAAGGDAQLQKDAGLALTVGQRLYPGDPSVENTILLELFHAGYDLSFLMQRPDLIEIGLAQPGPSDRKAELMPILMAIGFYTPMNNGGVPSTNQINNAALQQERRAAQQAQRLANQQAKAAQQARRLEQQKAKAFQQEQRRLAQQEAKRVRQAQQAERKAAQQAERRANQERRAAQQATKAAEQAARKAAQQAEAKAAQQAARQAQQAKQNLPPSLKLPIRHGRGFPGRPSLGPSLGPSRPSFGLRGSTSSTMSTRSHGGARFVNDPRAIYRG